MCRVELKVPPNSPPLMGGGCFLMCRVELKDVLRLKLRRLEEEFPNVPCGVESFPRLKMKHEDLSVS